MGSETYQVLYKIFVLFLLADGKGKPEELHYLDTISKDMVFEDYETEEILNECQELLTPDTDNSEKVIQEIKKELDWCWDDFLLEHEVSVQAKIIWTLLNLGYADQEYSEPEQKIVKYLIERWKIKSELVEEMLDTAETILLLTKQKAWLETSTKSQKKIKECIDEIDHKIDLMFNNIQVTISEADAI